MKKQIAFIISVLFLASSAYAGGVGSLFDKALKAGRDNQGCGAYKLQVPSSKNILVDDALQYMSKKGYILTKDYSTKQMIRFGYYRSAIKAVEFIPQNELESYIANMPYTSQSGKAVIFHDSRKETVDVYWSGSVNNGSINGNGVGYTKLNNSMYIIKGRFENGIPTGSCEVVTATPVFANGRSPKFLQRTDQRKVNYTVGNSSNGYRTLFMDGKYGFINDRGDIVVSCQYGNVVQGFNDAGFAIVTDPSDGNQEIKINTSGSKLGYSDNQLRINEEQRLARIAEENRIAEEKFYNELVLSKNENDKKFIDNVNEYIRRFPQGAHIDEIMSYKTAIDEDFAEAETNMNYKKWNKGDKICYRDTEKGLVCGVLQSISNGKAKLKIVSGRIYNNQTVMIVGVENIYKDKEIWIGFKDGWHLATQRELAQLSEMENLQARIGGDASQVANSESGESNDDPKKWTVISPNDKDGYIDKTGKVVIQPIFEHARMFSKEGLAEAKFDGKWGLIDKSGNWKVLPTFQWISHCDNGCWWAQKDWELGFIDKTGKWMGKPQKVNYTVEHGTMFHDGLARVKSNDLWGFVDKTGKVVIELQFTSANDFTDGVCVVEVGNTGRYASGKYGIIDKKGKWIVEPQYPLMSEFSEGVVCVGTFDGKVGFMDKTGKWVIAPKFDLHNHAVENGDYDGVYSEFRDGLAPVLSNGKYGCIDKTGQWVIEPRFDFVSDFKDGYARARIYGRRDGKDGAIDKKGNWVIQPTYCVCENIYNFVAEKQFIVYQCAPNYEFPKGVVDAAGKIIISPKYSWIYTNGVGELYICEDKYNKTVSYINSKGEIVYQEPLNR